MNSKLKAALGGELLEYRSVPFWSWNNSLDENELVKQIEEMKAAGIGGFIMHARTGLKDEYLGEKWFSCIGACLKKARELGMQAWVYDENGWPSGFCGGKLLENESFRARFLEYKIGDYDESAFAVFIRNEKHGFVRVKNKCGGAGEYHNVYLRVSPANTDILNPAVTEAFIAETHEKYYARFKEYFGKELVGFFTDEPQYYRYATPYTPVAEAEFAKNGEDIKDGLIWLFVHDERGYAFRKKYYKTLNDLYVGNFYGKIYEWCKTHGCLFTGHSVEETALFAQMWGGAAVMPSYEYEDIPAIDRLGRFCGNDLDTKQVSSVAAQLGKKRILTESFGCSGYDVTPYELKSIAEFQYFGGVNLTCQHLYPYSVAGRGRIDHPPVFGPHGNWNEGFRAFNDYFARLSYIITNTEEVATVGVIHPMRDIWLEYIRDEDYESVKQTEDDFNAFLTVLRNNGVCYQFIDESIAERHGKADGNLLAIGKRAYDTVILPPLRNISASVYGLLKDYRGKLCVTNTPEFIDGKRAEVSLESNVTLDEVIANRKIKFFCADGRSVMNARSGEIGDFIFIKNTSYCDESRVTIAGVEKEYRALNLETLEEKDITDEFVIPPSGSVILVKSENAKRLSETVTETDVTEKFGVVGITDNYFVMDYVEIKRGDGEFSARRPIPGIFEDLLHDDYKGIITVRQRFTLTEKIPLKLVMEKAKPISAAVNGKEITFGKSDYDVNFVEADITEEIRVGENVFEYSLDYFQHDGVRFALFDPMATESLRNCLYYDTSIENAYLKGDFVVNSDFSLSPRTELPPVTDELYKCGYPFFKGEITLKGVVCKAKEGRMILGFDGRFMTAKVRANGREKLFALDSKGDISDILENGENEIIVTLRSSMRNVFGPHHYKPVPEPMGVSPDNFEFRGGWYGGRIPDRYTSEYNFVPFGVKKIVLINEVKA
mgnify:CR=1 FL=1